MHNWGCAAAAVLSVCLLVGCAPSESPKEIPEEAEYQKITYLEPEFSPETQRAWEEWVETQFTQSAALGEPAEYVRSVMMRGRFERWQVECRQKTVLPSCGEILAGADLSLLIWTDGTYFMVCDPSLYKELGLPWKERDGAPTLSFSGEFEGETVTSPDGAVWLDMDPASGTVCGVEEVIQLVIGYSGPILHANDLSGEMGHILMARIKL